MNLSFTFYYLYCVWQSCGDKFTTTHVLLLYFTLLPYSIISQTHTKTHKVDVKLSRKQIREWLSQYPKSAWWINNWQIADYCRISGDEKNHNSSIWGRFSRFFPHGEAFWQRLPGKWVEMQPNCACHCVLYLIHCIYYLFVMFLALFCSHSRHQHHMWTCLTGLGNGRGWQLFIWYTHNVGVLWSCGSVWVHADARRCVWVYVDVWECL